MSRPNGWGHSSHPPFVVGDNYPPAWGGGASPAQDRNGGVTHSVVGRTIGIFELP